MSDVQKEMQQYYDSLTLNDQLRLAFAEEAFHKETKVLLKQTVYAILLLLLKEGELSRQEIVGQLIIDRGYTGASDRVMVADQHEAQVQLEQCIFVAMNTMLLVGDLENKVRSKYLLTELGKTKAAKIQKKSASHQKK